MHIAVLGRMIGTGPTEKVTFERDLTLLRGYVYPRMSHFSSETVDSMSKVPRNPSVLARPEWLVTVGGSHMAISGKAFWAA